MMKSQETRIQFDLSEKSQSEYQRIAEGWLIKHVDQQDIKRTPKNICVALRRWSEGKRPATFRKMRRALAWHQRDYPKSIASILAVKRIGHGEADTKKKKRCKVITEEEHQKLRSDARSRDDHLMVAALAIAYWTGIRPAEMPGVRVEGIEKATGRVVLFVPGSKKNDGQARGMDKHIAVADPDIISAVGAFEGCDDNALTRLKRRVSDRSRKLWPRRKHPPTLYAYRHQMGTDLKASDVLDRRVAAAIMGHRSQESLDVYGHRNAHGGLKRAIPGINRKTLMLVKNDSPRPIPSKRNNSRSVSECLISQT